MSSDIEGAAARAARHITVARGHVDDLHYARGLASLMDAVEALADLPAGAAPGFPSVGDGAVQRVRNGPHRQGVKDPTRPGTLAGALEVALIAGVGRQRAWKWTRSESFPAPVDVLRAGPVWRRADVVRWLQRKGWPVQ